jgi:iron complex transport system ATP-binding protein
LAQKRAFLNQKSILQFPFTVEEVVQFGQFHRQSKEKTSSSNAPTLTFNAQKAMEEVQVDKLSSRLYTTLSGGEACRVDLARVLTQQTPILLLDEPTNHLDPRYQVMILSLCKRLAKAGVLVIAALHDLNFASQYCSRLLMLQDGQIVTSGTPEDVLLPKRLEEVYNIHFEVLYHEKSRPFVMPLYHEEYTDSITMPTSSAFGEIQ